MRISQLFYLLDGVFPNQLFIILDILSIKRFHMIDVMTIASLF
jgi:hypothetical protein